VLPTDDWLAGAMGIYRRVRGPRGVLTVPRSRDPACQQDYHKGLCARATEACYPASLTLAVSLHARSSRVCFANGHGRYAMDEDGKARSAITSDLRD
jgi:hypothetical protein